MWERCPCQSTGRPASREPVTGGGPRTGWATTPSLAWALQGAGCLPEVGRDLVMWQVPGRGSARWEPALSLHGPGSAPSPCHPSAMVQGRGGGSLSRAGLCCSVEVGVRSCSLPPRGSPGPGLPAGMSGISRVALKNSGTGPSPGPLPGTLPRQACGRGPRVCSVGAGAHQARPRDLTV